MASVRPAGVSELAVIDQESWVERNLTKYVNEPLVVHIPTWVKPNTISIVNHVCCWSQLACAFMAVYFDERQTEYASGQMEDGRDLRSARLTALCLRFFQAFLNFATCSLDCLDGMHARRTGQTSKLGEVLDHSLDAANIALIASAAIISLQLDKYTVACALLTAGTVFNSQLVVFRHTHRFIKPPTNGPEAQMMVVVATIFIAVFLSIVGRFNPAVIVVCNTLSIAANLVQCNNTRYFWGFLTWNTMADHVRFCMLMTPLSILYLLNRLSPLVFVVSSIFFAFRLSGVYVMFIVANRAKAEQEQRDGQPTSPPLQSAYSSAYSGLDWSVAAWILAFLVIPSVVGDQRTPVPEYGVSMESTFVEMMLVFLLFAHTLYISVMDLLTCVPVLVAKEQRNTPLLQLLF